MRGQISSHANNPSANNDAQADSYLELLVPQRKAILERSAALGWKLQSEYPGVKYEQLAVEIAVGVS